MIPEVAATCPDCHGNWANDITATEHWAEAVQALTEWVQTHEWVCEAMTATPDPAPAPLLGLGVARDLAHRSGNQEMATA